MRTKFLFFSAQTPICYDTRINPTGNTMKPLRIFLSAPFALAGWALMVAGGLIVGAASLISGEDKAEFLGLKFYKD